MQGAVESPSPLEVWASGGVGWHCRGRSAQRSQDENLICMTNFSEVKCNGPVLPADQHRGSAQACARRSCLSERSGASRPLAQLSAVVEQR